MPEYLTPGVYVRETSLRGKSIEGVSTSNLGILGQTERGPTGVKLVTSFREYQRLYGGYMDDSYTTYAVKGFFENQGQRCYVGRVVKENAVSASLQGSSFDVLATGEGTWGNRVAMRVENAKQHQNDANLFKLTIGYWSDSTSIGGAPEDAEKKAVVLEVHDNLSTDNASPDYFVTRVNGVSALVKIEQASGTGRPANTANFAELTLDGGEDGGALSVSSVRGDSQAPVGEKVGLEAFREVDDINIVYAPDVYETTDPGAVMTAIEAHCSGLRDRFAILETNVGSSSVASIVKPVVSSYAGYYHPWIEVSDPTTKGKKLVPPGGHIAGVYARCDTERGVHKAPANEVVRGALGVEFDVSQAEQGILNPKGVNVIRKFPQHGIRVWGARTTDNDIQWKYINVRRLFLFLEESIYKGTEWVVFEPNDQQLWARVKQTITNFLTAQWRTGALMGTTPEEAFFVNVGRDTMTQADIDNGSLICVIGVAPVKPAEFVIFRILQRTVEAP